MVTEEWRPIAGYEGLYEVSDQGRVRSLDRVDSRGRRVAGRVLSPRMTGDKRDRIRYLLSVHGKRREIYAHQLVAWAFLGAPPEGKYDVLHWDDNPQNNHPENLRWGDDSENMHDRVRNGRHLFANQTHCKRGHPLTPDNTYRRNNKRHCRECRRIHHANYRARKRADRSGERA